MRSHFPDWVKYFTDSLLLGTIGKEIIHAGEKSFIDSPANWQAFWQNIHKQPEPKTEEIVGTGTGRFEHPETTKIKSLAWETGNAWMAEQRRNGKNPGINAIAQYIEHDFKMRDIRGKKDDYLDWQSIKKFITGITGRPANGKGQKRRKQAGDSPEA